MSARSSVLSAEHELLCANLSQDELAGPVLSYGCASAEMKWSETPDAVGLCDLSGLFVQLVEGADAPSFIEAACAVSSLHPGQAAFGAVLAGDGGTIAIPLVARTGICEYVVFDATARAEVLAAWLGFLSAIECKGVAPYAHTSLTDASGVHVPLALVGSAAVTVLGDYVRASDLPLPGAICSLELDRRIKIVCLQLPQSCTGPAPEQRTCYVLFVAPVHARTLWRSFLSFPSVVPIGRHALASWLSQSMPWLSAVGGAEDRLTFSHDCLRSWGLARAASDFIGARAMA